MRVKKTFYSNKDTAAVARQLLGKLIVMPDDDGAVTSAMIVETEAYLGTGDRAAHSYGGRRTPRNEVMYGPPGHVYVFFIYGMYYQFNIVTGPAEHPHAILIRGAEPVAGIEKMYQRRNVKGSVKKMSDLASGPGKLCIAMAIDRSLNGECLLDGRIWLEEYRRFTDDEISVGKRIGIDYAGEDADLMLRFWVKDNPSVSKVAKRYRD